MMPEFLLRREQEVPSSLEEVFAFFADARNLETLTPPWLGFEILTPGPITMRAGALIDYSIRLRGIPMRWQSEITVWEPGVRFVDEQRRGPYRYWIHEHAFKKTKHGTRITDTIRYSVLGGTMVNKFFVRSNLEAIFDFRAEVMASLFGTSNDEQASNRCQLLPLG